MLTKIKQGLYSDVQIIFNGTVFRLHNEYLKYVSSYFGRNQWIHHEITFLDINGKILDSMLIENVFSMLYDNSLNLESFNVTDLIEIYRLFTYFSFRTIELNTETCLDLIKGEIYKNINTHEDTSADVYCREYSIIYNRGKKILELTYDRTKQKKQVLMFKLSNILPYFSKKYSEYKYMIKNKTNQIFFNSKGKIFFHRNGTQIATGAHIDIDYVIKNKKKANTKYTFAQSYFLLDLLIDDNICVHKKIISEMKITVEDISRYPKKFHKLICKQFSEDDDIEQEESNKNDGFMLEEKPKNNKMEFEEDDESTFLSDFEDDKDEESITNENLYFNFMFREIEKQKKLEQGLTKDKYLLRAMSEWEKYKKRNIIKL